MRPGSKLVEKWTSPDGVRFRFFLDLQFKVHSWTVNGLNPESGVKWSEEKYKRMAAAADKVCDILDQALWDRMKKEN